MNTPFPRPVVVPDRYRTPRPVPVPTPAPVAAGPPVPVRITPPQVQAQAPGRQVVELGTRLARETRDRVEAARRQIIADAEAWERYSRRRAFGAEG